MRWLKQSTAVTVKIGPFIDDTDFKSSKTSLTIQKADVRLSKNGGDYAAANADQGASDAGAPHDELGDYDISFNTTDTNTLGHLKLLIKESGALHVWDEFHILPANVWDSLFGSANLQVDPVKWNGTAVATPDTAGYPKVTIKDGTGTGELDTASGIVQADVRRWNNTAVPAEDTAGYPKVTVKDGTGTGEIDTASGKVSIVAGDITSIQSGLATASALATVDTVVDAILVIVALLEDEIVDTHAEPGQGAPAATATRGEKLDYLYKWARNKTATTGSSHTIYNDAGSVVDHKHTVADDGTTYDKGEIVSGP